MSPGGPPGSRDRILVDLCLVRQYRDGQESLKARFQFYLHPFRRRVGTVCGYENRNEGMRPYQRVSVLTAAS